MEADDVYESDRETAEDCPPPFSMISRSARAFERGCCCVVTYLPLTFVYGLTSWATWGVVIITQNPGSCTWIGKWAAFAGLLLYGLLNVSYTTAVFTNPGTTTDRRGYSSLPTQAPPQITSFTVKSNGETRFCKKCQARKPDRAHHCSTCRRCVLKMDHHCPWLATCVGLRNHKSFLLFLIYTTLLCVLTFAITGSYSYTDIILADHLDPNSLMPVNHILLAVVSGLLGLVVGPFTGWHLMLACRGQTTIECLEKTRYLSPISKSIHDSFVAGRGIPQPGYGQQLIDMHANALPGITRPEEGEERRSPPNSRSSSIRLQNLPSPQTHASYQEMETYRSRRRYEDYQDEEDSKKLPNAFDLGWRANLGHLFGYSPWLWMLPVCNTIGDGWSWPANPRWVEARDKLRADRERQRAREERAGWALGDSPNDTSTDTDTNTNIAIPRDAATTGPKVPSKADRILGRDPNIYQDPSTVRTNGKGRDPPLDIYDDDGLFETTDEEMGVGETGEAEPPKRQGPKRTANGFVPAAAPVAAERRSPLVNYSRDKKPTGTTILTELLRTKKDSKTALEESRRLMDDDEDLD